MASLGSSSDAELSPLPSELDDQIHNESKIYSVTKTKKTAKSKAKETKTTAKKQKRSLEEEPETIIKATKRARTQRSNSPTTRAKVEEVDESIVDTSPRKRGHAPRKAKTETVVRKELDVERESSEDGIGSTLEQTQKRPRKGAKATVKKEVETKEEIEADADNSVVKKVKRKRKTKEEKEAEAMPLAARTPGHKMFVGAHVSSAGGVHNAVTNSVHIGGNAFALFLKSQRKWENPALKDEHLDGFHSNCKSHSYDQAQHVLPHGSYLVNLAHADAARSTQAYDSFLDDLQRCEKLGIKLYNFHPGNTNGNPRPEAIARLAAHINNAHKATPSVVTVLETMAAGGNVIGSTFEDLRDTIALVSNKSRVGVCLDTAHVFAAGYDIRKPSVFKETLSRFDDIIGMKYLKALHLNDSKAPFDSRRDLHFNIGLGFLGLRTFHSIMNEPRFHGLPLVLETPITKLDDVGNAVKDAKGKETEDKSIWAQEIKLLESLVDMDVEGEEFRALDEKLQKKGEKERKRVQDQVDRRADKKDKSKGKGKGKKGKKLEDEDGESESDDEE